MVNRLLQGNILNVITADEEQLADGLGIILPATDILENEKSCEHECSCAVGYVVAESLKLLAKLEKGLTCPEAYLDAPPVAIDSDCLTVGQSHRSGQKDDVLILLVAIADKDQLDRKLLILRFDNNGPEQVPLRAMTDGNLREAFQVIQPAFVPILLLGIFEHADHLKAEVLDVANERFCREPGIHEHVFGFDISVNGGAKQLKCDLGLLRNCIHPSLVRVGVMTQVLVVYVADAALSLGRSKHDVLDRKEAVSIGPPKKKEIKSPLGSVDHVIVDIGEQLHLFGTVTGDDRVIEHEASCPVLAGKSSEIGGNPGGEEQDELSPVVASFIQEAVVGVIVIGSILLLGVEEVIQVAPLEHEDYKKLKQLICRGALRLGDIGGLQESAYAKLFHGVSKRTFVLEISSCNWLVLMYTHCEHLYLPLIVDDLIIEGTECFFNCQEAEKLIVKSSILGVFSTFFEGRTKWEV